MRNTVWGTVNDPYARGSLKSREVMCRRWDTRHRGEIVRHMWKKPGKGLLLVGTVHTDPSGAPRLRGILENEKPSAVALELSPYGLYRRIRQGRAMKALLTRRMRRLERLLGKRLRKTPPFEEIYEKIRPPFEYRAALRYCTAAGAPLYLLDSSELSRSIIEGHWQELISYENLRRLSLIEESPYPYTSQYGLAKRLMRETDPVVIDPFVSHYASEPDFAAREACLAESLIRIYESTPEGTVAYVGGWEHLLHPTSFNTVCDRVAHLNPARILICGG